MFAVALVPVLAGVQPLQLVNISVIFGMAVMPFTYYPIFRVAADKKIMGQHANTGFDTAMGVVFLVIIFVAAAAAIPLMILTHFGRP